MGSNVDDRRLLFTDVALEILQGEVLVQQHLAAEDLLDAAHLIHHRIQCRKTLHRFADPGQQDLGLAHIQRFRIGHVQAGRYRQAVFLDQELLAVVQRRHRHRIQRPERQEHQRFDVSIRQLLLKRPHQPVVKLTRGLFILICSKPILLLFGLLRRSDLPRDPHRHLQRTAERTDRPGHGIRVHRQGVTLDRPRQADQQLQPVVQQNRIHHRRVLGDGFQPRLLRLQGRDALVLEVVAKLGALQQLHRLPGFHQQQVGLRGIRQHHRALQQGVHQVQIHRRDGLAEEHLGRTVIRQAVLTGLLQHIHRPAEGADRVVRPALRPQQMAFLPMPAVHKLRRLRFLRQTQRLTRQEQPLFDPVAVAVQTAQTAEGERQRTLVAQGMRDHLGVVQSLVRDQQMILFARVPVQLFKRFAQMNQDGHLVAADFHGVHDLRHPCQELFRDVNPAGVQRHPRPVRQRFHHVHRPALVLRQRGALAVTVERLVELILRRVMVPQVVEHRRQQAQVVRLARQFHTPVEILLRQRRLVQRHKRVAQTRGGR